MNVGYWIEHNTWTLVIMIPLIYLFINQGMITIERPYYEEYKQLQLNFIELDESKCPIVKCKETPSQFIAGIIWMIVGVVIMFLTYLWSIKKIKELKEREAKITKRENKLDLINFSKRIERTQKRRKK